MTRNVLADATSPYLRQHAANPVHWQVWGAAAFAEARRRAVPVLVSIGYSTCHWCHVMAHESFEDPALAAFMNEGFVCIKVDREEHPEVDEIYMDTCQAMTGQGGWPLNAFTDPAGVPFFVGTYFPPAQWQQVLLRLSQAWQEDRVSIDKQVAEVAAWLRCASEEERQPGDLPSDLIAPLLSALDQQYHPAHPGFGRHQQFPPSCTLLALQCLVGEGGLRAADQARYEVAILEAMQDGGLHERVGGGFHRYTVDASWRVPHFEKMLSDNALLMAAYARAGIAHERADFLQTAINAADYLLRDMRVRDADGHFLGYASAEDADDPGGEGAFYAWSPEALRAVLGTDTAAELSRLWDLSPGTAALGPSGHGEPVPGHIPHPRGSAAFQASDAIARQAARAQWEALYPQLRAARATRPRPSRDDKVLTDLNGLALLGLAEVARASGAERFHDATRELARLLCARHHRDGLIRLPDRPAYITDYGHLALGLLAAYRCLGEPSLVDAARAVVDEAAARLRATDGGFYTTPAGREDLPRRSRDDTDGAIPAGQSALAWAAVELGHLLGAERYLNGARDILAVNLQLLERFPQAATTLIASWWQLRQGPITVVITGSQTDPMQRELLTTARRLVPRGVAVIDLAAAADRPWPALQHGRREHQGALALICHGHHCLAPAANPAALRQRLFAF